jgi:ABC-2 type transport system permease protein
MFLRLLRADWLKLRRSVVFWTAVAIPLGYAGILIAYFGTDPASADAAAHRFRGFIEGWSVLLPLVIGLWSGLIAMQEEQAGQFAGMLGTAAARPLVYLGKLTLLAVMTVAGTGLAAACFLLGGGFFADMNAELAAIVAAGVGSVCLGSLFLVAAHLFVSFAAGLGAVIGLGAFGSLVAAIVGSTVIGDALWPWVPWAWGTRMTLVSWLSMTVPDAEPYGSVLRAAWREGAVRSVAATAAAVLGSLLWFQRWEGRRSGD